MRRLRARTLLAAWPVAAVALARERKRLRAPRAVVALAAGGAPLAFAFVAPRGRARAAGIWALQMWAYKVLFELPYEEPWRLRRRLRIDYPIAGDRLLGGGRAVPQRVQTALRRPALDKAVSAFYMSWDLVPHGALAWLLLRHPRRFPRSAAMLGATIDLTLLGYWLVPTAPPWWASRVGGRMDGEVHRVFTETRRGVRGRRIDDGHDSRGANPWAAMPSDHLASCVMLAIVLAELGPLPGALGSAYAAAMAFALAYLGEHYATDMLAGLTLALAVRAAEPAAREPLAALVERFETAARSAR